MTTELMHSRDWTAHARNFAAIQPLCELYARQVF